MKELSVLLAGIVLGLALPTPANAVEEPVSHGPMLVELSTKVKPALAVAGGRSYLIYELHITNFVPDRPMTIDGVEVLGPSDAVLVSFDTAAVARNLRVIGPRVADDQPTRLAPGQRAILFLWVPVAARPPLSIHHRVRLHIEGVQRTYLIEDNPLLVSSGQPLVLRPPLAGGPWVTANGPDPNRVPAHNQLLYPEAGVIHVPQRFATDWVLLDQRGRQFSGAIDQNTSYAAYGVPVLAVADGTVVAVHDGVPENRPPEVNKDLGQPDRAGNYIVVKITPGAYAFYGHLRPGSITAKIGQKVISGQKLAALGNSGNSTAPHLHFHVTNGASLASEGVPFVFDKYDDLGQLPVSLEDLEQGKPAVVGTPTANVKNLPQGGRVVRFRNTAR
jgi:murein DD-endopeptidase MepM/ murein hydrolase activator NlpD